MTRLALFLALSLALLVLAGCTTSSMRREMDVSGTLPKLIGLGGFAPSCFMFCFVENKTSQGDVIREDAGLDAFSVQSTTESVKSGPRKPPPAVEPHLRVKPKAKAEPVP